MKKVFKQGQGDGMCGLYAILNFLHRSKGIGDWSDSTDTLWYLLDACRQFGWLNPYTLTQGFEEHQLKAILDLQIANYRMPLETHSLDEFTQHVRPKNFYDLAEKVTAKGGAIVTSWDTRCHWLLVMGHNDDVIAVDSAPGSPETKPLSPKQRSLSMDNGIVILRRAIVPAEIIF